ncbi:lipid-A-disaccharide synthase [Roseofilum sp. BLCC_M91]|uniref:Lipid-A-disaccharide synthase n=1 Tax=Roseofilum halophilum BLCC-M91 TaxID=3022259 RepID=A0ABT7BI05_9CYAN|nr:lipid-A-disaccharide synthase [Roseofilum halophilum BLCC-M91]
MSESTIDILILSNGPGELTTWVRPVVKEIRQALGVDNNRVRISVVLSPCPNASGSEMQMAAAWPEVNRVQGPEDFIPFLLWGKTAQNWPWSDRGLVLFLGGDQFFTLVLGKRLGYRTLVYAEWEARWQPWIDQFAVMNRQVLDKVKPSLSHKFTVVGDLMADSAESVSTSEYPVNGELIALLPGSKPDKLRPGLPFSLAIAQLIHQQRPQTQFIIPVAPTLDIQTLAQFGNPQFNPTLHHWPTGEAELIQTGPIPRLKTPSSLEIDLWTPFPAYDVLRQCQLCITTVGANTAELGSLGIPMIVLLPTQQLDAMRSWDGIWGLLAHLPAVGSSLAKAINKAILFWKQQRGEFFAWPNIWANEMIVPEWVGHLEAEAVAQQVIEYLEYPEQLEEMGDRLAQVRGHRGAAAELAQMAIAQIDIPYSPGC